MLSTTINYLFNIASEALNVRDPWRFLYHFSPYHTRFHMQSENMRDLGFLIFHWCVIFYFKAVGLESILRIMPYTINDFSPRGRFYTGDINCSAWLSETQCSQSTDDLITYSQQIERCHNSWHMAIETGTRTPMMNAALNIYYPAFWNLHFFINNLFETQLDSFRAAVNPTYTTAYQVIQDIDRSYPRHVRAGI